jgi:quinoprotein glucose dehydrogenase
MKVARRAVLPAGLVAAGLMLAAPAGLAQEHTVADGVFTAGQAARGARGYAVFCAHCHASDLSGDNTGDSGAYPLRWDGFMEGSDAAALFEKMARSMPLDAPGALSDQQYVDIQAFLFEQNGFPAGDAELPADLATLAGIRIVRADTIAR